MKIYFFFPVFFVPLMTVSQPSASTLGTTGAATSSSISSPSSKSSFIPSNPAIECKYKILKDRTEQIGKEQNRTKKIKEEQMRTIVKNVKNDFSPRSTVRCYNEYKKNHSK